MSKQCVPKLRDVTDYRNSKESAMRAIALTSPQVELTTRNDHLREYRESTQDITASLHTKPIN